MRWHPLCYALLVTTAFFLLVEIPSYAQDLVGLLLFFSLQLVVSDNQGLVRLLPAYRSCHRWAALIA